MKEEKKDVVAWVRAHKKELLIVGFSVSAVIVVILGIKNIDALFEQWESLKASIEKTAGQVKQEVDVVPHALTIPNIEVEKKTLIEASEKGRTIQDSFDVSEHIRNLHPGWNASPEKRAEAERLGITLRPGQTLVDAYTKGGGLVA